MPLFRTALFVCGWIWLFCKQGFSSLYHEPLVREGSSYSMSCTGNLSLTNWTIYWINNNSKHLSSCYRGNVCIHPEKRFQATIVEDDNATTSILTIENVTWEDRGQTFTCFALQTNNGSRRESLGVWNISRSYLPPDPPLSCNASLQEGQVIRLLCGTYKVYPDISCQPVQIFNGNETSMEIYMHYYKNSYDHHEYYSATCSGIIFPYIPGSYQFCVNSTTAAQPNKNSCTETLTITNQTTVRIAHDVSTVKICPGENNFMVITCEILWWLSPERPTISCYIDDEPISNSIVVPINRTAHPFFSFESFCSFIPTPEHNGKSIKCAATYRNNTQEVSKEAKMILSYPSLQPPRFVYKGNEKTNQTSFIMSMNANVSVECTVESESANNVVTVECADAFLSESYRFTQQNKAELTFLFHNDIECTCTVDHGYNCAINPAAKLTFVASSWLCLSFHCLRYILLLVPVAFGILIISVMCWRARKKRSNKSLYSFFRIPKLRKQFSHDNDVTDLRSEVFNATNSEVTPYLVVDIVKQNTDSHKRSNISDHSRHLKQCQISSSSQNCFRLPRRKPPPLPGIFSQHTAENTTDVGTGIDFRDNGIGVNVFTKSTNISTEVAYYNLLPGEDPPPLPPRIKLNTEQQLPETPPLPTRNSPFNMNTTWPNYQRHDCTVDTDDSCCKCSDDLQSLPKQPPPPVPCGLRSHGLDKTKDELTARYDTHTNQALCEEGTSNATAQLVESVSTKQFLHLQHIWPPPPFKARRQTGKKRNKKSKKMSHVATAMISPNLNEDLGATSNTKLDGVVNTHTSVKGESLLTKQNTHETFMSDDSNDDVSNSSSQTDESDVCNSLLSSGSSSTCSSA